MRTSLTALCIAAVRRALAKGRGGPGVPFRAWTAAIRWALVAEAGPNLCDGNGYVCTTLKPAVDAEISMAPGRQEFGLQREFTGLQGRTADAASPVVLRSLERREGLLASRDQEGAAQTAATPVL